MALYELRTIVVLDKYDKCYKKLIAISPKPKENSLQSIIKLFRKEKLSPFEGFEDWCNENKCLYLIMDPNNKCEYLCMQNIPTLFSYLISNKFKINTQITNVMLENENYSNDLICFIEKIE
jgi:hypothetical protein